MNGQRPRRRGEEHEVQSNPLDFTSTGILHQPSVHRMNVRGLTILEEER